VVSRSRAEVSSKRLLALILLAGAVLRLWYASYDTTETHFWDERYWQPGAELEVQLKEVEPRLLHRDVDFELLTWQPNNELSAAEVS